MRDALYLAGIICDAVPTRAQDSDDPTMKHLGQCVNQGQYQIIQRAIETVKATLDAAPVSKPLPTEMYTAIREKFAEILQLDRLWHESFTKRQIVEALDQAEFAVKDAPGQGVGE